MILLKKGKHKFVVSFEGGRQTTIILDTTQQPATFKIHWEKVFIEATTQSMDLSDMYVETTRLFVGWTIHFYLDYSSVADEDFLEQVGELIDSQAANDATIEFYPREDDINWHSPVIDTTDIVDLRLLADDDVYEGLYLSFKTAKTVKTLDWIKGSSQDQGGGSDDSPAEGNQG